MNAHKVRNTLLGLIDDLVAEGREHFSHSDAVELTGKSPTATSNLLRRMVDLGVVDRIRQGHYVIRRFGVLGTRAAAESIAVTVGAAFADQPHRIAYRSALDAHDLITHPSKTIHVAATKQMRVRTLSGYPLRVIREPEAALGIGGMKYGPSHVSNVSRALLDAATRPNLVGGSAVLAEALASAGVAIDVEQIMEYAHTLERPAAIRRLGSIADALNIPDIAGMFQPLAPPLGDIKLEPGLEEAPVWRDSRWKVQWLQSPDELANVIHQ